MGHPKDDKTFVFQVEITCEKLDEAMQVMSDRFDRDREREMGFNYYTEWHRDSALDSTPQVR